MVLILLRLSHVSSTYTHISVCIEAIYHYWSYAQLWHTSNSVFQMTGVDRLCMKSGSLHLLPIDIHYVDKLRSLDIPETRAIYQPSFQGKFVLHYTSSYPTGSRYKYLLDALQIDIPSSALSNFQTSPWHTAHIRILDSVTHPASARLPVHITSLLLQVSQ